jgi:YfiH family protein
MFNMRRIRDLAILQSDLLPLNVPHGVATKRLATTKPVPGQEVPNYQIDSLPDTVKWWSKLQSAVFKSNHMCFANRQVHGGKVNVVVPDKLEGEEKTYDGFKIRILGEGDAIVKPFTRMPIFLAVTTADCLPSIIYDRQSGAIGVVHSGWRGLAADIPANALKEFRKTLNSNLSDLIWATGPSIDIDNYQVGTEVIGALEAAGYAESDWKTSRDVQPGWIKEHKGEKYRLNMSACLLMRLMTLGLSREQIDISTLSTFDNPNLFYSNRRDGGIKGLQASVIAFP